MEKKRVSRVRMYYKNEEWGTKNNTLTVPEWQINKETFARKEM